MAISWRRDRIIFRKSLLKDEYERIWRFKARDVKGKKLAAKV